MSRLVHSCKITFLDRRVLVQSWLASHIRAGESDNYTAGGSVSRAKCRCFAIAAMNWAIPSSS